MHDGDHEIFEKHQHKHKSNQAIKIVAGIVVVGLVIAFVVWRIIG